VTENLFDKYAQILKLSHALVGVVAQLVERLNGIQEVASSILVGSTNQKSEGDKLNGMKRQGFELLRPSFQSRAGGGFPQ
jgi:hypothetical protein